MIRVLLVEDEPPLLRSMQRLIQDHFPDFRVVGMAHDGQDAISLLSTEKPDVIITDLVMPVVDGFEILRHIREHHLEVIPLILSGHDDFEYARQALRYEAFDYLLKPFSLEDARMVFPRLSQQCYERRAEREIAYLSSLLNDDVPGLRSSPVELPDGTYILGIVCAGAFLPHCLPASSKAIPERARQVQVRDLLRSDEKSWVFDGRYRCERILLLSLQDADTRRIKELGRKLLSRLSGGRYPLTIVLSPTPSSEEINRKLKEVYAILRRGIVFGKSSVIGHDDSSEAPPGAEPVDMPGSDLERQIVHAIREESGAQFPPLLQGLFRQWDKYGVRQPMLEKLIRFLVTLAQRSFPLPAGYDVSYAEFEIDEAIQSSVDYGDLLPKVTRLFDGLRSAASAGDGGADHAAQMKRVEDYIRSNLAYPLDAQMLADKVGLSTGYLSTLFKQHTGMTPTQYLIHLRMEKAKVLIGDNPRMLLKDVAGMVGYEDPLYFSRVFKSKTGYWPSAFRDSPHSIDVLPAKGTPAVLGE